MKKLLAVLMSLTILLGIFFPLSMPVAACDSPDCTCPPVSCGNEGLTPGFWKNHLDAWPVDTIGFWPSQTLEEIFDVPDSLELDNYTLLQALSFQGGPGLKGMACNMLRANVAALLNAASPEVDYNFTVDSVIGSVDGALASGNRSYMEYVKNIADQYNNLGLVD